MSIVNISKANVLTSAWKKALPSQINDSFHQINEHKQERVLAFLLPYEDITGLALEDDSTLKVYYGYDSSNLESGQPGFKMLMRSEHSNGNSSDYFELQPQSYSSINDNLPVEVRRNLFRSSVETTKSSSSGVDVNIENVTTELIPPTFEHWLFYEWQSCPTSMLVDKVEALYHGQRLRIEDSVFDTQVSQLLKKLYTENDPGNLLTLVLMGLHQVIPGDPRIYHFGPILQSYPIGFGSNRSSREAPQGFEHPVNFELSRPCPPCDQ